MKMKKTLLLILMIILLLPFNNVLADLNVLNNIRADKHYGLTAIRHMSGEWENSRDITLN